MGITDNAIGTYVLRVAEGINRERALDALLKGRSLNEAQKQYVRTVLNRLPD